MAPLLTSLSAVSIQVQIADGIIAAKIWLYKNLGVHDDALHVHLSLLILFTAAIILRRRADSIWCWLVVFFAQLLNEYADITGDAAGEGTIKAAFEDFYTTLFWPTVILLFGRLLFPKPPAANINQSGSSDLPDQSFKQPPSV